MGKTLNFSIINLFLAIALLVAPIHARTAPPSTPIFIQEPDSTDLDEKVHILDTLFLTIPFTDGEKKIFIDIQRAFMMIETMPYVPLI